MSVSDRMHNPEEFLLELDQGASFFYGTPGSPHRTLLEGLVFLRLGRYGEAHPHLVRARDTELFTELLPPLPQAIDRAELHVDVSTGSHNRTSVVFSLSTSALGTGSHSGNVSMRWLRSVGSTSCPRSSGPPHVALRGLVLTRARMGMNARIMVPCRVSVPE